MLALNLYSAFASFLGTSVEFVEALTIILAVGVTRGWKTSLTGAFTAIVILAVLVAGIGAPLVQVIKTPWVALIVGLFMLLFGIRWLRKAILRYSGLKALHDESESYEEELERQKQAGQTPGGIDKFGFATTLGVTFLEGLEAIFIVITIGLSTSNMTFSIAGAVVATIILLIVGVLLRSPLTKVPENTMKFIVGVMLTSFGAFWVGEGLHVNWPQKDVSILYIAASLLVLSWVLVTRCKSRLAASHQQSTTMGA